MKKAIWIAGALLFATAATPALAHGDDRARGYYSEHYRLHTDIRNAHKQAHEEGFYSRREHRAYHRALRDLHRAYHDDGWGYYPRWRHRRHYWRYRDW